jgi:hypothetical protein
LLGDSWTDLAASVRRLHAAPVPVKATGVFRVRWGDNWLARVLARLARLPAEAEAAEVHLVVTQRGAIEEWRRSFASRPMVSWQSARPDGLLAERMGLTEMRLRLQVVDKTLTYQTEGLALCLGPRWRLPLPNWLGPSVRAREELTGEGLHVFVEVRLPLLGRLIGYDGMLTSIEER